MVIKKDSVKEEELKKEARKISVKEGSFWSIMDGFGLRYITPYALALGASRLHIGFLTSLPALIGNISQLFAPRLMEKNSRRRIVFWGVLMQALMWLALIFIGVGFFVFDWESNISSIMLVLVYTLLILFGAAVGPAWSSWMKDIVDKKEMGRYFGKRGRIAGVVALISMLIAGFILDYFKQTKIFIGFSILFFIAFVGRVGSAYLFTKKYEPKFKSDRNYYFSIVQFFKEMRKNNFGRFVIFTSLMGLSVSFAAPFFAVYMLEDLGFSYLQFTVSIISSSIFSLIALPLWGKFSDSYGNLKSIRIAGFFISTIPLLWLVSYFVFGLSLSRVFIFILIIEGFAGFTWAGYNLSAGNFIYDAVSRERMALCVAYFNVFNGFGVFFGATLGGFVASQNFSLFGLGSLLIVFLISSLLRFSSLLVLHRGVKEVREVKRLDVDKTVFRYLMPTTYLSYINMRILKPRPY